jgi:ceramide glucosyltransferase
MLFYYIFAAVILLVQLGVFVEAWRHLIYTVHLYKPKPSRYKPKVALICPCKGLDTTFERNIQSLFELDYPNYELYLVVESQDDPAYKKLCEIIGQQRESGGFAGASLVVAGPAESCGQKVHNLLTVCKQLPADIEVMAFVDSDACLKSHFLSCLVHPLRVKTIGASTGYRWFVPMDNRLASKVLSATNAFFASTLGPHPWNSVWGGAMAIRREVFGKLGMAQLWRGALADDYSLTYAIKKAGLVIKFVPACFVASYEKTSWKDLISFTRRQFIITGICRRGLWYLALCGFGHFVLGFWVGLFVSLYLWANGSQQWHLAAILPVALMVLAMAKALSRQIMIRKILAENRDKLLYPGLIDIFTQPVLAVFTLACVLSTVGVRRIVWRGKNYILRGIDQTEILSDTDS